MMVNPCERLKGLVPIRAMDLALGKFDETFEVTQITLLQEGVEQHRAERGRERDGKARVHAVAQPALHDLDERKVGFGNGFVEPVLFKEALVLRVAHKRQVRVENE